MSTSVQATSTKLDIWLGVGIIVLRGCQSIKPGHFLTERHASKYSLFIESAHPTENG